MSENLSNGYIKLFGKEDVSDIAAMLFKAQYSVSLFKRKSTGRAYESFIKFWKYGYEPKDDGSEQLGTFGAVQLGSEKDRLELGRFLLKNGYTVTICKKKRENGRPYEYFVRYCIMNFEDEEGEEE